MVAFQPIFKLLLVSLNLVVFPGLQTTSVVANSHDGSAPVDNAIRRHAARAGRLSKRFPPVSGTNSPTLKRKHRHHRFGLTPSQIEKLLNEEEIEDSNLYVPASNSTNTTSTSHHAHHRTRPATDSKESTGTAFSSFALPTSNSTSTSNTTSSAAMPSVAPTSHSHSTSLHNSTASANSSDADNAPPSRTASSSIPASSAPKDDNDSSSDDTQTNHTSASRSSDGLGGLPGPLLSPSSTSASQAAQQTFGSQQGSTGSSDDDDDQYSTGHPPSRASSPSATSSSVSPASTSSQASNNNDDDDSDDTPVSSSHSTKTTQPDFYNFRPQPTISSTQAGPSSSTSGGLLHGILPGPGHLLSGSDAATATPAPAVSSSDSNNGGSSASNTGADADSNISSSKGSSNGANPKNGSSDQSPTSKSNSASSTTTSDGSAPTDSAGGSDGTTSQTSTVTSTDDRTTSQTSTATSTDDRTTSQTSTATSTDDRTTSQTSTVTTSPTSTSQGSGTAPTGTNTGNGSDSVSTADHQSSSASNTTAHAPTSTASNGSDSGNGSGSASASQSATNTTNPYWYANTRSLNLAPSSTSSTEHPKETASQRTDSGSSTDTHKHPDSSTAWLPGSDNNTPSTASPQDLPTTIVPSADSYDQPDNTTSIGLLFKQDMKWTWVISQADLTAQIFAFMPELVGQAVSLDASKISTVKLASYSPETGDAATTGTLTTARTLYMAYVPKENVEDIQAMVSNVSSPFYTSAAAGAPQQLASQVDPTFNILSAAGQVAASAQQKSTSGSSDGKDESKIRNSLIGVGCGLAGFFAIAVGGLLWRKQRKDKVEAAASGNNGGGISRAHTIRSFSGGLRETWAPDALDQHRALATVGQMQQVWTPHDPGMGMAFGHPAQPMQSHADGFGGYVATDPFHDAANINAAGGYVNMNRSSRMTERSTYSDVSQMTEAQRIQYDYESSRRSFHSTSDHSNSHGSHSEHSTESAGMLSTYQDDYRVPRQHTFGATPPPRSNSGNRTRRRGSVASSTIGRPEMMSNSVLL